ncbi:sensor histidine kinase [Desulfovibrio sulfodismutans]|uniref:Sensor histidine kinase n=1 Tax=Desulfolutivibrio sulfodismutans TaxID=63561 RepID=A0A7K3NMG9_9BACT|nr:sensor histidine kinase [Desulfolutivibrio sulfodismutans]NDY57394.1 sensor histidine kinase [Desulfolutivibrio sulfodismutans]QLA12907.1 sensor histidine kinase [Desulfolutivibrio sulfodismutans DSM 3696]
MPNVAVRSALAAILAFVLLAPAAGCLRRGADTPVATHGVLDLAGFDLARDGPAALDGQWEFYWDRLLSPEDFGPGVTPPEPSGFMTLPGVWKGYELHGQPLPGYGKATFRLRLSPPPGERRLALRISGVNAAYRLWADGRLIAESGVVGDVAGAETSHRSLAMVGFESHGAPIDLVLQVSNHVFRRGGLRQAIMIGLPDQVQGVHVRIWAWSMFFVGSLLIMAVYHLALHYLRKKDISSLYFAISCTLLVTLLLTMDSSDTLINLFFPDIKPDVVRRIPLVAYAVLGSILYRFYKSIYPDEFFIFVKYICDIRSVVFVFIIVTQPDAYVYKAVLYLPLTTLFVNLCILVMLGLCLKRGRDGSSILFIGYAILSVTSMSDIYRFFFGINVLNLLPLGMLAFALSQALALAQRFTNAFSAVEGLSRALTGKNAALRAEMDERTRLEREIVNVSEEERRRLSHDLHDGLCQQLGGARLRCAALEHRGIAEGDVAAEVAEISLMLKESVSQAYDLSRGLWPVEHTPGEARPSLDDLARRVSQSSGVAIEYVENLDCEPCRNEHLVQFYRIAQEAVANAVKHAQPGRITITLSCGLDRLLALTVRDDGIGLQAAVRSQGGLGMRIMSYRARMIGARLSVEDAPGGGTVVTCLLACGINGDGKEKTDA